MSHNQTTKPERPPLGYRYPDGSPAQTPVLDDDLAEYLNGVFVLYAYERLPLPAIARQLAKEGFIKADGEAYSPEELRSILSNPFYAGRVWRHGKLVKAGHEMIIDKVTFDVVQRQLATE